MHHPSSLFTVCNFNCLPYALTVVSCLAYSTLKIEAICSPETSVNFQRTTRHYIAEGSIPQVLLIAALKDLAQCAFFFNVLQASSRNVLLQIYELEF
jgi:uncharacterized membrane protein